MSSLLNLVCSTTWALRPEALEALSALVQKVDLSRHEVASAFHYSEARCREAARAYETKIPLQAVGAYQAQYVRESINLYRRGSVAVLPITGPITRYSNLFQMMSGQGTSVEALAKDFRMAMDDPSFSSVLLSVDSPGGESNGINEFANMVYEARDEKPVWAFVSDLGASAAYWITAAAERVVTAETAALGSIGCMAIFQEDKDEPKKLTFVSSVSPRKNLDPHTKTGAADIQALVDTLGQIFVDSVATFRDTTSDDVKDNFGSGGILVGADAVERGLADAVGTFEGCIQDLEVVGIEATVARGPQKAAVAPSRMVDMVASLDQLAPVISAASSWTFNGSNWHQFIPNSILHPAFLASSAVPPLEKQSPVEGTSATVPEVDMSDQHTPPPTQTVDTVQAEIASLRAENQRLRLAAHEAAAQAFADARIHEMRVFPSERDHIVALYLQAASDDDTFGPGLRGTLRVQTLANAIAARTSVSHLTAEALAPTTMQALHAKVQAASADPNAPMTEAEKNTLLSYSPLGKSLANGQGRN